MNKKTKVGIAITVAIIVIIWIVLAMRHSNIKTITQDELMTNYTTSTSTK